ncbi:MAG: hypothetical protein LBT97_08520 [Planctomycetota bacterium]|jgi:flagellar basal-body rod modification protein FlgD|nr:hypothetical protein [Planctomycetota bacterium]
MSVGSSTYDYSTSTTQLRAQAEKDAVSSGKVTHQDFLKLLTTQLTKQDPLNPMQDIDFTAQLAQLQALDEQVAMTKSMQALRLDMQIQAGSNMIGKYVSGVDKNGEAALGMVTRVAQTDGNVYLELANGQQLEVSGVSNLWNDSSSMSQEIINSGGIIGMWVDAGYDSAMQPIQGIVEKALINNGVVQMQLYGGKVVSWDQVRELRSPTEDELLYTYPDEVRLAYADALKNVGKVIGGVNDKGGTVGGMVANAGIIGSDVYYVLYNGEQVKVGNVAGDPRDPAVEDYAENLGGFWVEGLDALSNDVAGVVIGAEPAGDGVVLVLANGDRVYFDALTKIREATADEKQSAIDMVNAGGGEEGGGDGSGEAAGGEE